MLFELSFTAQEKGDLKGLISLDNRYLQTESYTKNLQVSGITLSTDHLRPGQLLHMAFYFVKVLSTRGFTAVLVILDAKTRKMWQFPTPQKRPPLNIITYYLTYLYRSGRSTQHVCTDCGRELAR